MPATNSTAYKISSRHLRKHVQPPGMFYLSASFPSLRQSIGKPGRDKRMGLRNLQMLPLVNCPNGTALSLGTYDSKLNLLRSLRSYVTHSNRQSLSNNKPLIRYVSSKLPLAGQEFLQKQELWPGHISSEVLPSVLSSGYRQKQNQETYYLSSSQRECY